MTEQERNQVWKMIENGKITPEEGLNLMQALDRNPVEEETVAEEPEVGLGSGPAAEGEKSEAQAANPDPEADARFAGVQSAIRRFWQIPLWIGIAITVFSAVGMYAIMRGPGANFWFYFLMLPLFLGVALTALTVGSQSTRWIFVDVRQRYGEWPERIFWGFPLPLKFTAWLLRTFGGWIPQLKNTRVDEIIQEIETAFAGDEPMVVNVDEGGPKERVRIYVGIPSSRRPIWPVLKNG